MSIRLKLKNSVVQDSTPSASDLPEVGELAVNGNINSIGGFMRASDNSIVKIFGPGSVTTPTATTTVSGISELATNSETTTGTATNRVVTPAGLNAVTTAERTTSNTNYVAKAGSTLTGVLTMPNGSNSAPAINFGDSDSGIFGGTNTVSLAAGGTTRLTADTGVSITGALGVTGNISNSAGQITCGVTGTSGIQIINDGTFGTLHNADLVLRTHSTERARLDTSGRLLVGHSSNFSISGSNPRFQLIGGSDSTAHGYIGIFSANNVGANFSLVKSRNGTIGGQGLVLDDDVVGNINFVASDGGDAAHSAARISAAIDGTAAANDLPGRLVFSTTIDGANSPAERLRIANNGNIFVNKGNASGNATIILDKSETGAAKLEFDKIGSQKAYIELDAAEDLVRYGVAGVNHIFYSGTERMRLDDSGRLLIGTTTEGHTSADELTLSGSGDSGLTIRSGASSEGSIMFSDATSGGGEYAGWINYNHNDNFLRFFTAATEHMRILSTGNVGIGTTSPSEKLEVSGDIQVTSGSIKVTGTSPGVRFTDSDASGGFGHVGVNNTSGSLVMRSDDGNALSNSYMGFEVDGGEKMRISSSGNLALGTTITNEKLHLHTASSLKTQMQFTNTTTGTAAGDGLILGITGGEEAILWNQENTDMYFATNNTERMRITSAGSVGIGTTSPSGFNPHAQELVVHDASGTCGITISTPNNTVGRLAFADPEDDNVGEVRYTHSANTMEFTVNAAERMRIDSSGIVGIGTTAPEGKGLDVTVSRTNGYAATSDTRNLANIICRNSSDGAGRFAALSFINGGGTQAEGSINLVQTGNYNGDLAFKLRTAVSDWAERMRIQSDGMVGIGTTGPKAGLHVATENTTYGKNAVFGANGWVNNANYHYTDATISLLGQDADGNNKGAGIEFSTRNSADTNWRHGAINQERDSDLVFILGGSGTFQGVERLRIKGNGLMAFNSGGTVNATYQFDYAPATGGLIVNANAAFTGNSVAIQFRTAPSTVSGNITLTNNGTTTAYGTSSDYRLKENAVAISDGITRLKTLKPYRFNFKSSPATTVDGFFAHEVTAVPEAITGTKDETKNVLYTEEDTIPSGKKIGDVKEVEPVYQSMDYAKITPLLTAALQEAITKIETLETKVAALEAA